MGISEIGHCQLSVPLLSGSIPNLDLTETVLLLARVLHSLEVNTRSSDLIRVELLVDVAFHNRCFADCSIANHHQIKIYRFGSLRARIGGTSCGSDWLLSHFYFTNNFK